MLKKSIKAFIVCGTIVIVPSVGNPSMLNAPHLWALVVIGFLSSVLQPDYRVVGDKDKAKQKDGGTELQIIWSVFLTQMAAVLEAAYLRYPQSVDWDYLCTAALVAMGLGLALRTWSIHILGQFFTMHLATHKGHYVIRHGPYRFVRHPSYVGAFFVYMGTSVLLHSWYSFAVAAVLLPIAWVRRISFEERMLREELGEEYRAYARDVKRAIPGIW